MKESEAHAVKLEGGVRSAKQIKAVVRAGIPVMAHIGFTPQSEHGLGGHVIQGRGEGAAALIDDAHAVEEAGAFAVVLEMVPSAVAAQVTKELSIPTLSVGAGPHCDGQLLVWTDWAGLTTGRIPKFVKRYADLAGILRDADPGVHRRRGQRDVPGPRARVRRVDEATPAPGQPVRARRLLAASSRLSATATRRTDSLAKRRTVPWLLTRSMMAGRRTGTHLGQAATDACVGISTRLVVAEDLRRLQPCSARPEHDRRRVDLGRIPATQRVAGVVRDFLDGTATVRCGRGHGSRSSASRRPCTRQSAVGRVPPASERRRQAWRVPRSLVSVRRRLRPSTVGLPPPAVVVTSTTETPHRRPDPPQSRIRGGSDHLQAEHAASASHAGRATSALRRAGARLTSRRAPRSRTRCRRLGVRRPRRATPGTCRIRRPPTREPALEVTERVDQPLQLDPRANGLTLGSHDAYRERITRTKPDVARRRGSMSGPYARERGVRDEVQRREIGRAHRSPVGIDLEHDARHVVRSAFDVLRVVRRGTRLRRRREGMAEEVDLVPVHDLSTSAAPIRFETAQARPEGPRLAGIAARSRRRDRTRSQLRTGEPVVLRFSMPQLPAVPAGPAGPGAPGAPGAPGTGPEHPVARRPRTRLVPPGLRRRRRLPRSSRRCR